MKIFSLQVLRARPTSTQQRAALMQLEDGELDIKYNVYHIMDDGSVRGSVHCHTLPLKVISYP